MAEFAQILIRARDDTKGAFDSASRNLRGLEASAAKVGGLLRTVGIGAGLSVVGMAAFAKQGIDAADALNDMSQRLGVSVKDLASFKLAAEQSGTSLDSVGTGIARLSKSIGEAEGGNKKLAQALQTLGITARDPKEAFFQLADAVQRIEDPSKRAALLSAVLGKSYGELVPLLAQGSGALRESAAASATFAESMAKLAPDADRFNDQLAKLNSNAAGAAASILSELVPSLNEYIAVGREVINNGSLLDKVRFFGLGNASDEIVNRVRVNLAASAGWMDKLRQSAAAANSVGDGANKKPPGSVKTGGGSKADPLAGLLGSTDIGKIAAFDKQVALLNARFDGGRKSTELYNQAMTKLVETTFSSNFSEFNRQLAEQDETQRMVAEHLKATNDELFDQQQAWTEAGRALEEEMRTPLENANIEFARLDELLARGVITWETYARAVFKTQDALEGVPDKLEEMDTFAKKAAENIQDSFADFLFDPFDKGVDGMLKSFGQTIQRMIAEAVAADLAKRLFGDLVKGGSGSGIAGNLLTGIGKIFGFADGGIAAYGSPLAVNLPRYAGGGISNTAAIFGEAGPEAAVPLPDGRRIPVEMRGGGNTIIVNVNGSNNAPDVRRAAGQGAREALGMLRGAERYA